MNQVMQMHEKYHVNMFIRLSAVYTSRRDHSKDMITKCWVPWLRQFLDKNLLRWNANLSHLLHPLPIALKMAHFLLPKAHNLHCIPFSKGNFRQNTYSKSPSLSIFNTPSHWLLVSMVSDEKSALHLIEDFFVWLLVFLHCSQNSLSVFDISTMISSVLDTLVFILCGVCQAPYLYRLEFFITFGRF